MKTWLDRLEEARARGYFSEEDAELWSNTKTCPAAEIVSNCGVNVNNNSFYSFEKIKENHPRWSSVWRLGNLLQIYMSDGNFDGFEDLYHEMEDLALRIKRTI